MQCVRIDKGASLHVEVPITNLKGLEKKHGLEAPEIKPQDHRNKWIFEYNDVERTRLLT
jgi:hypothetical protein